MCVNVVLFTADLRLHDNPVLGAALRAAERVVPLFVIDSGIAGAGLVTPARAAFLSDCLADLDGGLRARGSRLIVRAGDVVRETCRVAAEAGATEVHVASGASGYAQRREERLRSALTVDGRSLRVHDAVTTAVAPGVLVPSGKDHYSVFTPYHRRWSTERLRPVSPAPRRVELPRLRSLPLPGAGDLARGTAPAGLPKGGETEGRRRLAAWLRSGLAGYAETHDDLAADATSRLSPYLHFGCLSPVEVISRARRAASAGERHAGEGAEAFVRQLAWRDFHHQVLAAVPAAAHRDYRARHDRWRTDPDELAAWRAGMTGYPVVDAAMRQLAHEGWMHNRARMLVASFLTKSLYHDWREGAGHFEGLLVDADVANNRLNWQWAAGTGNDTRPHRVLNPLVQARRFDPRGDYVRRWVPELAALPGAAVHTPWRLGGAERVALRYPAPVVDLTEGLARFRRARGLD
ncbi:cryptochrome/photolyase family protein [Streptomyces hesseae]|uniref:Deoxyribodipyrimidine photo-lyase n=1 Tax=Streptomyces hesseae TaxID=3075519 RepID=A0ABU2SGF8_9ACTN|nr:deoxyribodipyrimidine photo-lyase [Streptomyces sp. DSM 40473]MDT0447721.1 deoxyribodipyrimidine photo-lyase [Streptomyces sp. DSM 40473]